MARRYLLGALSASVVTLSIAGPHSASAQSALQRRLEAATRIECAFPKLAIGTWDKNAPTVSVNDSDLTMTFLNINVEEGTADAESGFGAAFISVRYAQGYLHFMQMSDAGPLYITTVFARDAGEGRMLAAQTRLEFSPTMVPGFTSRPELYVGSCAVS
jgi:hypothetical protein